MPNQTPADNRSGTDQILDLLLDALVERQKARLAKGETVSEAVAVPRPEPKLADEDGAAIEPVPADPAPARQQTGAGLTEVQQAVSEAKSTPAGPSPPPGRPPGDQQRVASVQRSRSPWTVTGSSPPKPGEEGWEPPLRAPSIDLGRTLGRLLIL